MSSQAMLSVLSRVDDASVDEALAAALPTADVADLPAIVDLILARGRIEGTLGLVCHYHALTEPLADRVIDRVGDLFRALREAARLPQATAIENALQIIAASGEMRLAYLVSERLRHGDEPLRDAAGQALLALTRRAVERDAADQPRVSARHAAFLYAAVEEAVQLYRHHEQQRVVEAVFMLVPRPLPLVTAQLDDWPNPVVEVFRSMLSQPDDATRAAALLPMLRHPALATAIYSGLHRAAASQQLAAALGHGHLLILPAVRRQLLHVPRPEALWPQREELALWPPGATRQLPGWLAALPLEVEGRVPHLVELRLQPDPMTRLAALRQLIGATDDPARDFGNALAAYCDDAEEAIAVIALRELIRRQWSGLPTLLPRLVNGPHARVRAIAAAHLAPLGFDRLWQSWTRLSRQQRLAGGRALIKIDPRFHESLGRRLASSDRDTVVRALSMIAELHQGSFFEQALLQLAAHRDRKIASAAVRALGSAESPEARDHLRAALEHSDARVRANAVEALEQHEQSQHVQKLVAMAVEDNNRPRANAIKALLEMGLEQAMSALKRMLADPRPAHRRSALWLVETLGLFQVARQVADLAAADRDPQIQQKARQVIAELRGAMHAAGADEPSSADPPAAAAALTFVLAAGPKPDGYWSEISAHFSQGSGMSIWWIVIASGLLLLVFGMLSLWMWRRDQSARASPLLVFHRVGAHVGLSWSDRWFLIRLARQRHLPTPLTLLVSPGTLMHHAAAWAGGLSPRRGGEVMRRADDLSRRLFGQRPGEATSAADSQRRAVA